MGAHESTQVGVVITNFLVQVGWHLVLLAVQHSTLRQTGFDRSRARRIGVPHHQTKHGKHIRGRAQHLGHGFRLVAHAAHVHRAQPHGFCRHHRILRGQCGINHAHQKRIQIVQAHRVTALRLAQTLNARQVCQPHQHQRGHRQMLLRPHQMGQLLAPLLRLHGNHAPRLQVGRGGRRLRRCHQRL